MVESQSSLFGGEGSSDSSSSASAITRRRVQRLFSPTAATDDASRTVPSSAMTSTSVAGPGPSTVAAAKEAAHEVVELDDSSSDSELELISAGYGPWHELLPTNPAVAYYQLEIISLTLGPSNRRSASGAGPDEGLSLPTEVGLLITLEFGKDKQFSQHRRGRGEEVNVYRVQPVQASATALLPIRPPRPHYSASMAMFGEVPDEWPYADPGIREAESARIRIELIRLRNNAGYYQAFEWMQEQLKTSTSYAAISPAARSQAEGYLPFGFVNLPLSPGLEQVRPPESSVAPLFWAGTRCEPKHEWNLRFRWRCNSVSAWRAKELEEEI